MSPLHWLDSALLFCFSPPGLAFLPWTPSRQEHSYVKADFTFAGAQCKTVSQASEKLRLSSISYLPHPMSSLSRRLPPLAQPWTLLPAHFPLQMVPQLSDHWFLPAALEWQSQSTTLTWPCISAATPNFCLECPNLTLALHRVRVTPLRPYTNIPGSYSPGGKIQRLSFYSCKGRGSLRGGASRTETSPFRTPRPTTHT